MSHDIILVDDEEHLRTACAQAFELAGLSVVAFESAEAALENIGNTHPGIVVTDVKMAGMGGLQLLATTQERDPQLPVILITGHGDIPTAVKAMQDGAYDFLEKPFASDRLVDISRRALELRRLVLENRALRDEITTTDSLERLVVGRTPPMVRLRELQNIAMRYALGFGLDEADHAISLESGGELSDKLAAFEGAVLQQTLAANEGRLKPTYEQLGISRKTLYEKIRRRGLQVHGEEAAE
jgi:DNA-binding NtrC family response regulator